MEKLVDNVSELGFKLKRIAKCRTCYLLEHFIVNISVEGCDPSPHLIDDAAKGPEVRGRHGNIVVKHLRRYVQGRTDE